MCQKIKLSEYVKAFATKGACTCGKCLDAFASPEQQQPIRHTVDVHFFKVAAKDGAKAEDFKHLVQQDFPHWLDGKEHNYLECGADIGDQGLALMAFGLGHLLGVWELLSPDILMPFLPEDIRKQMAGMGMIAINTEPEKARQEITKVLDVR